MMGTVALLIAVSLNASGLEATMPVKDVARWERIFRECAALYASNLPPATVTNTAN